MRILTSPHVTLDERFSSLKCKKNLIEGLKALSSQDDIMVLPTFSYVLCAQLHCFCDLEPGSLCYCSNPYRSSCPDDPCHPHDCCH